MELRKCNALVIKASPELWCYYLSLPQNQRRGPQLCAYEDLV